MEIRLIVEINRIEARYKLDGRESETTAIAFSSIMGSWSVATSMCMPSDIE